jgi:hypothetical protein
MKNFLTATIKVPVKIDENGEFIMLENYAEINIEKMTTEPKLTFQSLYEKMIEYIHENPDYLANIVSSQKVMVSSNEDSLEEKSLDNERPDNERPDNERPDNERPDNERPDNEEPYEKEHLDDGEEESSTNESSTTTLLHKFHYFNKSKTPLNSSFRNKKLKRNFTKKVRL